MAMGAGSGCTAKEEDKSLYAGEFARAWEGIALAIEGTSSTPCVRFSMHPGQCIVWRRQPDGAMAQFKGACDVEGGKTGKYVSLNCRNGDQACVPGENKIVVNLNSSVELEGTESSVVDSGLARRITPMAGTCEQLVGPAPAPALPAPGPGPGPGPGPQGNPMPGGTTAP
jgi:hypothetical protein